MISSITKYHPQRGKIKAKNVDQNPEAMMIPAIQMMTKEAFMRIFGVVILAGNSQSFFFVLFRNTNGRDRGLTPQQKSIDGCFGYDWL